MVCTANICRSPIAQGLLRHLLDLKGLNGLITVDSAGTHIFQKGLSPDVRAQQVAEQYGIDLSGLRSRNIRLQDFSTYDSILAMDKDNYRILQEICPEEHRHKISLVMDFAPQSAETEVPDPYFSNIAGFERVFSMLEVAINGVVEHIHTNDSQ